MIKLESAHIEEFRGIRKLTINFNQKTFAISGPNGSGKSGVIDAIEFGLTGQIGRLAGLGTKGLTVTEHGPHVDKVKFPDAAFVVLNVFIPSLGKSAKITRKVSAPKKPKIEPDDPDVRKVLGEITDHPEITLARRDILRFILVEPSKRSEEIQTILKLEEIGQTRAALNTANNKLSRELKSAASIIQGAKANLQRLLGIANFSAADLLSVVNAKRTVLGLPEILNLQADTTLDKGLASEEQEPAFNKSAALRDLKAVSDFIEQLNTIGAEQASSIVANIEKLELDPALLMALQRRSLIEKGLELLEGPECPMCDHPWPDEEHLLDHLRAKLLKSENAGKIQTSVLEDGTKIAAHVTTLMDLLRETLKIAKGESEPEFAALTTAWGKELKELKNQLINPDGLIGLKDRLSHGWPKKPDGFDEKLDALNSVVLAKPDQSATVEAQTFLANAQLRLKDYRDEMRKRDLAQQASDVAKIAYGTYCNAMEDELNTLYNEVQEDFSSFYRQINDDDEGSFTAKLTPSEGKLDFDVNFYDRGLFPPGAYHSEGHQDGMGVCLYLALMKHLLGDSFTIALLDDVVMSVDAGHRYKFCQLLKTQFPNTQFVIATHDRLWAEQMKAAKLTTSKTSLIFHGWTVDTGPLVESNVEIWDEIATSIGKGKVETAAHALRHHLEFVSRQLADQLGARPVFKSDGNYDLGDLLPCTLARIKELYAKATDTAQSWGNDQMKAVAIERKRQLANSNGVKSVEDWAVNKAVHYNEWANFGKNDFEPVVAAFKSLLECMQCSDCESWLYISPRGTRPDSLRCQCGNVNLNLKSKPK